MSPPHAPSSLHALDQALGQARRFEGATAPNPPVGAAAIDAGGRVLSLQAHVRAGTGHAEAKVLRDLAERGLLAQAHTLVITLEPCNHHGRTPPCTEAILASGVRRVLYGVDDPNPRVAGQGARRLREAGLEVERCADPDLSRRCGELIRAFSHWARTGLPWVTVKTAHRAGTDPADPASMLPSPGAKTFTSAESLRLAHELRRRADAILTGSGTVLADLPELTVRHVPEHPIVASGDKKRRLVVLDRRRRVPEGWARAARVRGFELTVTDTGLADTLQMLGKAGVLEVLVEAGPSLSTAILSSGLWNEHVLITQGTQNQPDTVTIRQRNP